MNQSLHSLSTPSRRPVSLFVRLVRCAILLLAACLAFLPARAADDTGAIVKATQAFIKKESPGMSAAVKVEKVVGDYARAAVSSREAGEAWAFLKRQGGTWTVLTLGTGFDLESYQSLGIPKSLRK